MDVRDLEFLVASASAGNFSRAAKTLGLSTSAVSRRIGRLEDELGLTLFERGHFGVRPTTGGQVVLFEARRALDDLASVRRSGQDSAAGVAGHIRLGVAFPLAGSTLTNILAEWRTRNPEVGLSVSEMDDGMLTKALYERRLDLALTLRHLLPTPVVSERLLIDRLLIAIAANHNLAKQRDLEWRDLSGEIILLQEWEDSAPGREFYTSLVGDDVKFHAHSASKQCLLGLVAAGFGITFIPRSQCEGAMPGVVFREIGDLGTSREIALAWLPEMEDAAVGRFVSFLRDEARARRASSFM